MSGRVLQLLRERQAGHSLAAPFYLGDDVFQADMDLIFGRHWIFVGQEPDVPEPGDVLALHVGSAPILLLRDTAGQIRAFHNVCRHRGAQLVPEGRGQVGNLVCRYHSWTYGTDGALLFAPHMGTDFDPACRGLRPVALRSVAGLLFVCLAADPPADILDMAAALEPYVAPHRLADTRVARQTDLIEQGNWKLVLENNRECYHCAGNHPELNGALFAYGFGFAPGALDAGEQAQADRYDAMVEDLHARWEQAGLPSRRIERLTGRATAYRTERLPLDQAGESHTLDARVACRRLLGDFTDRRLGGLTLWTAPNSWHHFMSDHVVTFCVLPLSPDRTLVRTTWLVHKDAVEGVDYDPANLTAVWDATNRQDAALVEMTQAGVRSPAYEPGPYSPHTEGLVEQFCSWYIERMAAGLDSAPVAAPETRTERPARLGATEVPPEQVEAPALGYSLYFAQQGVHVVCPPGRTVLAAARLAGLRLPFACGRGVCGTCKSRLLSGTVTMQHGGGIRPQEIDEGYALLCCAKPSSDLVVDR